MPLYSCQEESIYHTDCGDIAHRPVSAVHSRQLLTASREQSPSAERVHGDVDVNINAEFQKSNMKLLKFCRDVNVVFRQRQERSYNLTHCQGSYDHQAGR